MKKNISLIITTLLLVFFGSCGKKPATFTITGEVPMSEFEGCPIYLGVLDNGDTIDSAMVKNGKFQFSGSIEKPMMGCIFADSRQSGMQCTSILVLETGNIYINLITDSLSGTPLNDLYYQTYTANFAASELASIMESSLDDYYAAETPEEKDSARLRYERADSAYQMHVISISRKAFQENSNNVLGAYALSQVVEHDGITFDSLDYILAHASPAIADYQPLRKARTQLFHLANTSEGQHYADVEGVDFATGRNAKLSSLVDTNFTLIDFWASWCSPCRQEINDNLNRLYEQYHDLGLNVIGIDVWDKKVDHKAAVEQLNIAYPQLVDTVGTAVEAYGITGVPTILLLDRKGIIVKRGLRGEDIEAAVRQALNLDEEDNKSTDNK